MEVNRDSCQSCLILDMTSMTLIASKFKCAVLQIRPHCLSPIRHDENMSKGVILYNVWTVLGNISLWCIKTETLGEKKV